jgi:hypothetical protein
MPWHELILNSIIYMIVLLILTNIPNNQPIRPDQAARQSKRNINVRRLFSRSHIPRGHTLNPRLPLRHTYMCHYNVVSTKYARINFFLFGCFDSFTRNLCMSSRSSRLRHVNCAEHTHNRHS